MKSLINQPKKLSDKMAKTCFICYSIMPSQSLEKNENRALRVTKNKSGNRDRNTAVQVDLVVRVAHVPQVRHGVVFENVDGRE